MSWSKRNITLRHSDSPLTSKRVKVILSDPEDSAKLAAAVRAHRKNKSKPFKVSEATADLLKKKGS
ncbi:hypothetical protein A33Q_2758 [Indibacter alkaliphilus LW1]|uniref:Uncharacterized protein n=1 Tax=Indibacter alkaliphilus (strain CCUG 57479 / KCTC 22604 / LW1) TaxID=1189612 RepID=S2DGE7_INDAL|nr:hypothetical protein [Indibacter alkaliphilus]EOZ96165.1 hypothetical protein A33Q_2758 [Indibacter alkaliphilus LW1]